MINKDLDWDKIRDRESRFQRWLEDGDDGGHGIYTRLCESVESSTITIHLLDYRQRIVKLEAFQSGRKFTVFVVIDPSVVQIPHWSVEDVISKISDRIAGKLRVGKPHTLAMAPKLLDGKVIPITLRGLFEGNIAKALQVNTALKNKMGFGFTPNYQMLYWLGVYWEVAPPKYLAWLIWLAYKNRDNQQQLSVIWREMNSGYWIEAMQQLLKFSEILSLPNTELEQVKS